MKRLIRVVQMDPIIQSVGTGILMEVVCVLPPGLGHTVESYAEPLFIEHVWGGVQYAAGPMKKLIIVSPAYYPKKNRFDIEVLEEDLNEPMELEVLPNGNVIFIQRHGEVMAYDRSTKKNKSLHKFEVFTDLEDGLLGLALDPKVEENKTNLLLSDLIR